MFKVLYLPRGCTYTVYYIKNGNPFYEAEFLIYDEVDGWMWLPSSSCKPATVKGKGGD